MQSSATNNIDPASNSAAFGDFGSFATSPVSTSTTQQSSSSVMPAKVGVCTSFVVLVHLGFSSFVLSHSFRLFHFCTT